MTYNHQIFIGQTVILKNQIGKREAVVDGFADNGNLVLVRFASGTTKVVNKRSLAPVMNVSEFASLGGKARWKGKTKKERIEFATRISKLAVAARKNKKSASS